MLTLSKKPKVDPKHKLICSKCKSTCDNPVYRGNIVGELVLYLLLLIPLALLVSGWRRFKDPNACPHCGREDTLVRRNKGVI